MKKCPYCAEDIQEEAIICKHCNRRLPGTKYSNEFDSGGKTCLYILMALIGLASLVGILGGIASFAEIKDSNLGSITEPYSSQKTNTITPDFFGTPTATITNTITYTPSFTITPSPTKTQTQTNTFTLTPTITNTTIPETATAVSRQATQTKAAIRATATRRTYEANLTATAAARPTSLTFLQIENKYYDLTNDDDWNEYRNSLKGTVCQ